MNTLKGRLSRFAAETGASLRRIPKMIRRGKLSDTLHKRKDLFREMAFSGIGRKSKDSETKCRGGRWLMNRWSDCAFELCLSWVSDFDCKLCFVVNESSIGFDRSPKPRDCSYTLKDHADHGTIVFGREKEFAHYVEGVWTSR